VLQVLVQRKTTACVNPTPPVRLHTALEGDGLRKTVRKCVDSVHLLVHLLNQLQLLLRSSPNQPKPVVHLTCQHVQSVITAVAVVTKLTRVGTVAKDGSEETVQKCVVSARLAVQQQQAELHRHLPEEQFTGIGAVGRVSPLVLAHAVVVINHDHVCVTTPHPPMVEDSVMEVQGRTEGATISLVPDDLRLPEEPVVVYQRAQNETTILARVIDLTRTDIAQEAG